MVLSKMMNGSFGTVVQRSMIQTPPRALAHSSSKGSSTQKWDWDEWHKGMLWTKEEVLAVHGGGHHPDAMKERGIKPHHNPGLWQKIFYFVCVPALILTSIKTYLDEQDHKKHPHRPEYIPYEYLYVRRKKFPWGDGNHSLFHNPKHNPIPGVGYEEDL